MKQQLNSGRRYDVDWLRIILILSVFIFHIGMMYNTWGWHMKNIEQVSVYNPLWSFLHIWRMPLLFFISGVGTALALRRRSIKQYAGERCRRLLLPFFAGLFLLVPVQVYLEKYDQYSSLGDFYLHMFDGSYSHGGNFSWHHLWFILYLFLFSMIAIPVIKWLRSGRANNLLCSIERLTGRKGGLLLLGLPILISQIVLRPFFPQNTNALFNDWAYFVFYLLYFLYGYIFAGSATITENIIKQRRLNLLAGTIVTCCMFLSFDLIPNRYWAEVSYGVNSILLGWFVGLTVLGYGYRFMNFDSWFRRVANEAIYPFYLLHQPVIVFFGFLLKDLEMSVWLKFGLVIVFSFVTTVLIYIFFVRPFNLLRVLFGLKPNKPQKEVEGGNELLIPVGIQNEE
ncbi:MAG: acyltransferase family protein [Marinifilaceae bacterium]